MKLPFIHFTYSELNVHIPAYSGGTIFLISKVACSIHLLSSGGNSSNVFARLAETSNDNKKKIKIWIYRKVKRLLEGLVVD